VITGVVLRAILGRRVHLQDASAGDVAPVAQLTEA
jgi:hypothetical protein